MVEYCALIEHARGQKRWNNAGRDESRLPDLELGGSATPRIGLGSRLMHPCTLAYPFD